jgi:hypothetical protein
MSPKPKGDLMKKNKWKHDCKCCVFVSTVKVKTRTWDLYVHADAVEFTYVARCGNKGEDYRSSSSLEVISKIIYQ